LPRSPLPVVFLADFFAGVDDNGGREHGSKMLLDQLGATLEREG
jgi:hypothetical protein